MPFVHLYGIRYLSRNVRRYAGKIRMHVVTFSIDRYRYLRDSVQCLGSAFIFFCGSGSEIKNLNADPDTDPCSNCQGRTQGGCTGCTCIPPPPCASPPPQPERLVMRGGGVGQPKMCIPPGKILGTPLLTAVQKLK
jgi:hypothetical protein